MEWIGIGDLAENTILPEKGHSTADSGSMVNSCKVGRMADPIMFTMLSMSVVDLSDLNSVLFGDYS